MDQQIERINEKDNEFKSMLIDSEYLEEKINLLKEYEYIYYDIREEDEELGECENIFQYSYDVMLDILSKMNIDNKK